MALMHYKDVLVMCKEKMTELMAPLRAREMRKKAELEACQLDSRVAELEQKVQEIASQYPINFGYLIDAIDELELVKRRKEQFDDIIEQMFKDV